jgi:hypothetical protein
MSYGTNLLLKREIECNWGFHSQMPLYKYEEFFFGQLFRNYGRSQFSGEFGNELRMLGMTFVNKKGPYKIFRDSDGYFLSTKWMKNDLHFFADKFAMINYN